MLALFFRGGTSKKKPPYLPPEDGFHKFKGGFLTLGLSSFQAFPSPKGQWHKLEFVPDYSSGGCVRFSRTSLSFKPEFRLSKKDYLNTLIKNSFALLVKKFLAL
jgi:hypothetical protein